MNEEGAERACVLVSEPFERELRPLLESYRDDRVAESRRFGRFACATIGDQSMMTETALRRSS